MASPQRHEAALLGLRQADAAPTTLYHISEDPSITRFDPRPARDIARPVVWALNDAKLRNYLLPRDCPRVTFFADRCATPEDRKRFLGSSNAVVAIESAWLDRVRTTRLYCYNLPETTFTCVDRNAGYFHSTEPVVPVGVQTIDDPLAALLARGVEFRVMPSLWTLHDTIIASTLSYSMIRMVNARARDALDRVTVGARPELD